MSKLFIFNYKCWWYIEYISTINLNGKQFNHWKKEGSQKYYKMINFQKNPDQGLIIVRVVYDLWQK
jgi:hypothetical protein